MVFRKSLLRLQGPLHQLPATNRLKSAELAGVSLSLSESLSLVFTPLAIKVGIWCILAQCVLYLFFKCNGFNLLPKSNVWSTMPSYTAHQVMVFPLMACLVWQGMAEWFLGTSEATTPQDRLLQGSFFSEIVIGIMLWDIPVTTLTPQLRNLPMTIHHVAMVVTAALSLGVWSDGAPLFGYYAPFFFGVTEVSTLPLIVMDLSKSYGLPSPEWAGPLFAFLFLTVRAVYFPYVSITSVLPDIHKVAAKGIYRKALYVMTLLNMLFTILQLYWGTLVVQEIITAIVTSGNT